MIRKSKKTNNIFILIFLILGIILLKFSNNNLENNSSNINLHNNDKTINLIEDEKTKYFARLEIPQISLIKDLFPINSKKNNVNKSIEIIFPSVMPDNSNSLLILAAHSGNSSVSYFKDLDKLKVQNIAYIKYSGISYSYEVIKIERQNKNGLITINKNKNKSLLILTTCDQKDKKKQIVITLKLIKININDL